MQWVMPVVSLLLMAWLLAGAMDGMWNHNRKRAIGCTVLAVYCFSVGYVTWPY